jgi:hypothetical protein
MQPGVTESLLQLKSRRLGAGLQRAAGVIDGLTIPWRSTLGGADLLCRKGAVVERVVSILLAQQRPAGDVYEERRVIFSDAKETCPFDVLGNGDPLLWEGVECKAGINIAEHRVRELNWAASHAVQVGDPLIVIIASAADRTTLDIIVQACVGGPAAFTVVARDEFFTLA